MEVSMTEKNIFDRATLCGHCVWSRVYIDTVTHDVSIDCQIPLKVFRKSGCVREFSEQITGVERKTQADLDYEQQIENLWG